MGKRWGIPADISVELTVVYLGRLKNWEAVLTPEMKTLLVPNDPDDEANLSVDIASGPFRKFPHYATAGGMINFERANALSDLTGWSVMQNSAFFQEIFAETKSG